MKKDTSGTKRKGSDLWKETIGFVNREHWICGLPGVLGRAEGLRTLEFHGCDPGGGRVTTKYDTNMKKSDNWPFET